MTVTMQRWALALILSGATLLGGCGYNDFQRLDEQTQSDRKSVV